ncbi:mitochondrial ribosome-associated GTPase 1 isoform X2 [Narcine bancroftii]|uniref:mitochondrial ribosome-associated GTPase 1 isoform X2 n=1 Tax=Narcine bancroftii TaxID=1343680 RepID=UPI0038320150
MSGRVMQAVPRLRHSFDFGGRDVARWFPGHMAKGLKKMQASLKKVDCIIEVHDARIPLTGRNPLFKETLGIKPHLLVLNKMDVADLTDKERVLKQLEEQGIQNILFTDCLRDKDVHVKKIVPLVTDLIQKSDRYHRSENMEYCLMVIGLPNVGKSSLINALRRMHLKKGKASRVGGAPGITRAVLTKIQVCERPIIHLLDTPGVFFPHVESVEVGLKLALCDLRKYDSILWNIEKIMPTVLQTHPHVILFSNGHPSVACYPLLEQYWIIW